LPAAQQQRVAHVFTPKDQGINWERGFNRLFLVAAIGWAIFVVWYMAWHLPTKNWHELFELEQIRYTSCLSKNPMDPNWTHRDKDWVEHCRLEHEKELSKLPRTAWSGLGPQFWLWVAGFAAGSSLILYWLLRALALLMRWIWHGYRPVA